jgi:hypothetical protein
LQPLGQRGDRRGDLGCDLLLQPFALRPEAGGATIFARLLAFEQLAQQTVGEAPPCVAELAIDEDRLLDPGDRAFERGELDRQPRHRTREFPAAREFRVAVAVVVGGAIGDADQPASLEHRFALPQGGQEQPPFMLAEAVAPRVAAHAPLVRCHPHTPPSIRTSRREKQAKSNITRKKFFVCSRTDKAGRRDAPVAS